MNTASANALAHQWLPFTANRAFVEKPRLLARAEGLHFWNHGGDKLLDGCSGLFCCALGHGRPEITEAVTQQMQTLDYAPPFQFANPRGFELARLVAQVTPGDLNQIFFVNSGSESVDTAMKIALAYHAANGEPQRQRFVGRERGYHGVNFGGMTLGGMVKNKEVFGTGVAGVSHMRHTWLEANRFTPGEGEQGADLADDLQRFVDLYGPKAIAACFVEPIAGSTGVLVPPKGYLKRLREICDRHGILLVFDEVICGFGRTGQPFAGHSFDVVPDLMTMAKALTNGAMPMGAVAVRDMLYETVLDAAPSGAIELFHGYTYSAHPAACAAGIATQKIFRDEGVVERGAALAPYFLEQVFALRDVPVVTDIRGYGLLAGVDLAPDAAGPGKRGAAVLQALFEAGLVVRVTMDTIMLAPALVSEKTHIDEIVAKVRQVLAAL